MKITIMQKITNLKNNLKIFAIEFFHLFVAISLIVGLFYLRFLPRTARDLYQNMTLARIVITCFILACIFFNIYTTLKNLGFIETKELTGIKKNIKSLLESVVNYIYGTFKNLYNFILFIISEIAEKIFKIDNLHYRIVRPIAKGFINEQNTEFFFYILWVIRIFPRIAFLCTFMIEVFFEHRLEYTFNFIPYLLIIFVEPIFLHILKHFYNVYYEGVTSFLHFDFHRKADDIIISYQPGVAEMGGTPFKEKDLPDYFQNHFYVLYSIPFFLEDYTEWKKPYEYFTLVLQVVRLEIYLFIIVYANL